MDFSSQNQMLQTRQCARYCFLILLTPRWPRNYVPLSEHGEIPSSNGLKERYLLDHWISLETIYPELFIRTILGGGGRSEEYSEIAFHTYPALVSQVFSGFSKLIIIVKHFAELTRGGSERLLGPYSTLQVLCALPLVCLLFLVVSYKSSTSLLLNRQLWTRDDNQAL